MTDPRPWILTLLALTAVACTTIYQVRGVESELTQHIKVATVEAGDPGSVEDLEARSVEWLALESRQERTSGEPFKIGILEVNGDGAANPKQKQQVFSMLDDEAGQAREKGQNLVILVFIHGWHHGARVCDYNLACFRRLVGNFANHTGRQRVDKKTPSRYVGIYFGWRGESVDKKGFNVLTIWTRKRKGEHIGHRGARNLLLELDEQYRELKDKHGVDALMVTSGHSLGGGLLLSAMRAKLVGTRDKKGKDEYIRSSETSTPSGASVRPVVTGFGDLAILINPAIEATRLRAFAEDMEDVMADDERRYSSEQKPVLLAVTSEADRATRRIFPVSRVIRALVLPWHLFKGKRDWHAVGHYEPYRTHDLRYVGPDVRHKWVDPPRCGCPFYVSGRQLETLQAQEMALASRGPETFDAKLRRTITANDFEMDELYADWDPNSPFWIMRTNKKMIGEHNDIYNEAAVGFLSIFLADFLDASGY